MASKNKSKAKDKRKTKAKARKNSNVVDFNWEDFSPEWASEGIEKISAELEKWNDEFQTRSENFRIESQERIEKAVQQVQDELAKVPMIKRAQELREELEGKVEKNIEDGVDRVYTSLKLARLDELKRLERKIAKLNKKLSTLEKQQAA